MPPTREERERQAQWDIDITLMKHFTDTMKTLGATDRFLDVLSDCFSVKNWWHGAFDRQLAWAIFRLTDNMKRWDMLLDIINTLDERWLDHSESREAVKALNLWRYDWPMKQTWAAIATTLDPTVNLHLADHTTKTGANATQAVRYAVLALAAAEQGDEIELADHVDLAVQYTRTAHWYWMKNPESNGAYKRYVPTDKDYADFRFRALPVDSLDHMLGYELPVNLVIKKHFMLEEVLAMLPPHPILSIKGTKGE